MIINIFFYSTLKTILYCRINLYGYKEINTLIRGVVTCCHVRYSLNCRLRERGKR